ncbi:MAG: hypothetical protein KAQ85_04210 [Thermodesulfovibrionia bacterium]|nr:hypothetical protein [Thermodesulfovibrionia bacterium]
MKIEFRKDFMLRISPDSMAEAYALIKWFSEHHKEPLGENMVFDSSGIDMEDINNQIGHKNNSSG